MFPTNTKTFCVDVYYAQRKMAAFAATLRCEFASGRIYGAEPCVPLSTEGIFKKEKQLKIKRLRMILSCLLQKMGVEPTRYCYHTDLNRARLPIPPLLQKLPE